MSSQKVFMTSLSLSRSVNQPKGRWLLQLPILFSFIIFFTLPIIGETVNPIDVKGGDKHDHINTYLSGTFSSSISNTSRRRSVSYSLAFNYRFVGTDVMHDARRLRNA